jgi:glucose-6-phosphate isomerase, archaeal
MPLSGFTLPPPSTRMIDDMRDVLCYPSARYERPLYYMYRDVCRNETDRAGMRSQSIRYDVTIIPPANLGGEYVKTKGHYHPENPAGIGYPELYEVIGGTAHFLLQAKLLSDIVLINAQKGDIVAIPPGYGHVTINPSEGETLTMANLVSTAFSSEYTFYTTMHGAAYYELNGGKLHKNPIYPQVPEVRTITSHLGVRGIRGTRSSLYSLTGNEDITRWLNNPEQCSDDFLKLIL